MKHVFIINPIAGIKSSVDETLAKIDTVKSKYDIEVYTTTQKGDATRFVKEYIEKNKDLEVRFYACGGDGTLFEVVNGAAYNDNVSICSYPCGSGNDFVKCIGGAEKYLNIENIINAPNKKIDLIKVGDVYSINVANFGFDANVCNTANNLKGKSKNPYTMGIVKNIFGGMKNHILITDEEETINPEGELLLCSLGNGAFCGGKYKCAPRQVLDDGWLELCMIKCISLLKFLSLIKKYELGQHLDDPVFSKIIKYKRVKKIQLTSSNDKPFYLCLDGEILEGKEFTIEVADKAINIAYLGE